MGVLNVQWCKTKYGVDKETGVSFPDSGKIAFAYGIKYICINTNNEVDEKIKEFLHL
jgi:thiamine pyrophosphate-dependent acetolactate synthase large subunit-like protein